MRKLLLTLSITIVSFALFGQIGFPRPDFNPYKIQGQSILNPSNMKISHSMGFEAGSSSSGDGYYLSRYTNHIQYQFNPKLELNVDLNFINFGSANTNKSIEFNEDNQSKVIPEFSLKYQPSDSFHVEVRYEQGYSPYSRYRSMFDR